jgi:hypothetical protein
MNVFFPRPGCKQGLVQDMTSLLLANYTSSHGNDLVAMFSDEEPSIGLLYERSTQDHHIACTCNHSY